MGLFRESSTDKIDGILFLIYDCWRTIFLQFLVSEVKGRIYRLSTAVARIWAEIFKGTYEFDIVNTIGVSLSIYAETLDKTHSPIGCF